MADNRQMVSAVFRDRQNAERAFNFLHGLGYTEREINVLMSENTRATYFPDKSDAKVDTGSMAEEGMGVGGAIGTAIGASLAALAAIGTSIAIPGLGLVIAGPLAAALAGAGAGAVTGGIIGALVGWGIPEDNAQAYQQALREGGVVVGVVARTNEDSDRIKEEFNRIQGENVYVSSYSA